MDTVLELPTIKATEMAEKAANFARDLAARLDVLNQEHPTAEMNEKEQEILKKTLGDRDLVPAPQQFMLVFERLFCTYMASRFVVIPD